MSGKELQRRHGVGWRTVQAALASAWPAQRAPYPPRASKLDPFKPAIDQILVADLDAPRKQRHTITRIFDRLCAEHGMADVSYPVVRAYVARRRPEIRTEHGRADTSAFIPQTLTKTIARHGRVDLLCIDELGYMALDKRGAELLFQVLTEREEKASVAIASNEAFSGWTKTFTDPRLCAAIVDRLTFGGNIIETGTDSYRRAHTLRQRGDHPEK